MNRRWGKGGGEGVGGREGDEVGRREEERREEERRRRE